MRKLIPSAQEGGIDAPVEGCFVCLVTKFHVGVPSLRHVCCARDYYSVPYRAKRQSVFVCNLAQTERRLFAVNGAIRSKRHQGVFVCIHGYSK